MTFSPLIFIFMALNAWTCSYFAGQKGRNELLWFLSGIVFGLFALAAIFFLPSLKKPTSSDSAGPVIIDAKPLPPFPLKGWYYLDTRQVQKGPVSFAELQSIYLNNQLAEKQYVWHSSLIEWKTISEIPNLEQALKS